MPDLSVNELRTTVVELTESYNAERTARLRASRELHDLRTNVVKVQEREIEDLKAEVQHLKARLQDIREERRANA